MISRSIFRQAIALGVAAWLPLTATAGYFDCSVVYDEFDSLMNKSFLLEPDRYVQVQADRFSKTDFEQKQLGRLYLNADRAGQGVAVFTTNQNISGKLLYNWGPALEDEFPPLMINEVILFGRVEDGYAPVRLGPFRLNVTHTLDLDAGNFTEPGDTADIVHNIDEETGAMYIEAVNKARLIFPTESLCHNPRKRPKPSPAVPSQPGSAPASPSPPRSNVPPRR